MVAAMRIFHCDHCDHLVFFENHSCVSCGRQLAFLPDIAEIGSLDPGTPGTWVSPLAGASPSGYRLCANYTTHNVCNWAIPADDPHPAVLVVPPDARHPRSVDPVAARGLVQARGRQAAPRLQPAAPAAAGRQPRRRSGPRTRVRVPGGPAAGQRPGADRAPRRRHHHQPRRGRRRRARTAAPAAARAVSHAARPRPARGRPLLLGAADRRHPPARAVPRRCSATSAPTTARRCRRTTRTARRPTGSAASSPPTRPRIRGRTGPRRGRTTCT